MESRYYTLKVHLDRLQDHINDSWTSYEEAKNFKDMGEMEEMKDSLDCAKHRIDLADKEVKSIDNLTEKYEIDTKENAFVDSLYGGVLHRLEMLREKVNKMKI